jgi:hypothetical protein
MVFKVVVDEMTLTTDANGKIKVKLSADANNGLSFDASGNLIAIPGSSSGTGIYNNPGNGILGTVNSETHKADTIEIVGMNSTVSRHKKYSGTDQVVVDNDGPVMSKLSDTTITSDCIAYFMIPHNGGGT